MLDQEKNKRAESLTNLCHLLSVLYSLLFCVQWLSSLPRANRLSIFFLRWFFLTWFLSSSFFFKYVVCSELYVIEYNLFKEASLTVQHSPVLPELGGWSCVRCCSEPLHLSGAGSFAGLRAGCVGLSVQ